VDSPSKYDAKNRSQAKGRLGERQRRVRIVRWTIDPEVKREAEAHYRTAFALRLRDRAPEEIMQELTFDGLGSAGVVEVEKLLDFIERKLLRRSISGIGLEVGSGPGTFGAILARRSSVRSVYAVELCEPIVAELMPKVASRVLNGSEEKLIGVNGDFDRLELPEGTIDFVFDFFALHHSVDLESTLRECGRVLRSGGFILCLDKARPDHYQRSDLEELLDQQYDDAFKQHFGLPLDRQLTRRTNGEKEYRLKDWKNAFRAGGFASAQHFNLAKLGAASALTRLLKEVLCSIPVWAQKSLNRYLPTPRVGHKFVLDSRNRIFTRLIDPFPKEISLLIASKE